MKKKVAELVPKYRIDDFRKSILKFEDKFRAQTGVLEGRDTEQHCPLKHSFVPGAYIREIFMPKGTLLTSQIHNTTHPYFVMKGKCSVLTENGIQEITAPHQGITTPGTKRLLYMHEDTVWITVHPTEETDLDKIEDYLIAKTFDDVSLNYDTKMLEEEL